MTKARMRQKFLEAILKMDVGWAPPTIRQPSKPYVAGNARPTLLLLALFAAALAGCSTTGNKTPSLNQTLAVITSPTARTLSSVARSSDPKNALKKSLESRKSVYEQNPYALVQDVRTIKRDYDNLMTLLTGKVQKTWGKKEVKLPSRVQYIKYTQNYMR